MDLDQIRLRAPVLWLFMGILVVLVCVLAGLQYYWIGEISSTEQKRLQDDLQAQINKLGSDFNAEINNAAMALQPDEQQVQDLGPEKAYELRYTAWRSSALHPLLFRRIALVNIETGGLGLKMLNRETGRLEAAPWPEDWIPARDSLSERLAGGGNGPPRINSSTLIDVPRFRGRAPDRGVRQAELDWLLLDVDRDYAASVLLPELLAPHLGDDFRSQYRVEVSDRANPSDLIYRSDPASAPTGRAQAVAMLFDPVRPNLPRDRGGPRNQFKGQANDPNRGRWQLSLWLRNGTLESVVTSARHRNLAISAAILLLLLATGAALAQFSRRAQRLAEVEMDFVAGVSHELRTPLTVIRTAAFNLRGKVSTNPSQVERYGALIQQESERLGAIVEQVLRFASTKAGRVVQERRTVSVAGLVDETVHSNKGMLEDTLCEVQTHLQPGLPAITGDSVALRHALQNLLANAAKYGLPGKQTVEIYARSVAGAKGPEIEIRVADHGPGIPPEEQKHVFDAFYRGRKAVKDQIHGTGLGLHLVKKIVEAHGGKVSLESQLGAGSTFIVRIPAAPAEPHDEFAHSLG
jgi:signal transduction histidine kinase